jgi:hypothetical protein
VPQPHGVPLERENRLAELTPTVLIAAALAAALAYILFQPIRIHHDCAMYLQVAASFLAGRMPYVEVVELNPPLIWYINTIPVLASRLFGAHVIPTFLLCVWFASLASVVATRRTLKATFEESESIQADIVAAVLAIFSALTLWWNLYGQREHLFLLAMFPYLVLRFRRWERGAAGMLPSVATGLLAGVAACLKPHFVAIVLAPEVYWVFRRRSVGPLFRPETFALAGAGFAYLLHFLFVPEPMRSAFFSRWVPLIARGYDSYNMPIQRILLGETISWLPAAACAGVFALEPLRASRAWRFAQAAAIVALMSMAMFFLQQKGFAYHALPARAAAFVALALMAGETRPARAAIGLLRSRPLAGPVFGVSVLTLAALVVAAVALAVRSRTSERVAEIVRFNPVARAIVRHSSPREPVLFLATSVASAYPVMTQLGRAPASRYVSGDFPIPLFYQGVRGIPGEPFPYGRIAEPVRAEEAAFLADLRSDVQTFRPRLILVDARTTCDWCPPGFGMYGYLTHAGFMTDALGEYAGIGTEGGFHLYVPKGTRSAAVRRRP